jgi:hypothetical protein
MPRGIWRLLDFATRHQDIAPPIRIRRTPALIGCALAETVRTRKKVLAVRKSQLAFLEVAMRFHQCAAALLAALVLSTAVQAQVLYSQNFDVDDTTNWTVNGATNVDDPQSHPANFFFDYSDVGIPSAPNSTGGTTRGMKLQTNMDFDSDGISGVPTGGVTGMSVSPIGQSFTGDYVVKFDAWGNFPGPFPAGSSGTTQLSTFGVGTSGTFPNYPGSADGVWFAASHDGGTASDYRAYSQERNVSYQHPIPTENPPLDGIGQPIDGHATHHANSRNNTAQLYLDTFDPQSAPAAQVTEYPQQTGETADGVFGMAWHEVEISKIGNIYDWKVNGTSLITIDGTNFVSQPAGTNIMFGASDINAGASTDPLRFDLLFTLIDNVRVEVAAPEPTNDADFNEDGTIDSGDYTAWRKFNPLASGATQTTGDANGDGDNDNDDYLDWVETYGMASPGAGGGGAVPEPTSAFIAMIALVAGACCRRRC